MPWPCVRESSASRSFRGPRRRQPRLGRFSRQLFKAHRRTPRLGRFSRCARTIGLRPLACGSAPSLATVDTPSIELLTTERRRTLGQIAALTAERSEIAAARALANSDDEHDPEGATIAFEHARVGALLEQARNHLAAIDHAESRLRQGVLDLCERCGDPISSGRREARPTATTCIGCASRGS